MLSVVGVRNQQRRSTAADAAWLCVLVTIACWIPCYVQGQANLAFPFNRGFTSPSRPSGNFQGAFAHPPPGSPKHRTHGGAAAHGRQLQVANPGNRAIPELDKPTLARDSRNIKILPMRSQWQANYLPALPAEKLMAASLYPGVGQNFSLPVALDGNMAITVHPRRGFTVFNVTYLDVQLMTHPFFNSKIRQRMPLKHGEKAVQAMPAVMPGRMRKKRCCIAGATLVQSGMDIQGMNAGLGVSLGPGSLTYFKEDVAGGLYNLTTMNLGVGMAEIVVFTTLDPEYSPYPRIHGIDSQLKAQTVEATELTISWEAGSEQPDTTYCFVYHRAQDHVADDVHSSSFAAWMERDTATHLRCVKRDVNAAINTLTIKNLQPSTEYHIDLLAHNLKTQRETTYMGVQVRTAGRHMTSGHVHHGGHYPGAVRTPVGYYPGAARAPRGYYPGPVRTPTGLIRTPLHQQPRGGFRRDPAPVFMDNPSHPVYDPAHPDRNPKQPLRPQPRPGASPVRVGLPYDPQRAIYHPQGPGQRPGAGQRAGAGHQVNAGHRVNAGQRVSAGQRFDVGQRAGQQTGFFNPANPLGLTVFPPSNIPSPAPLVLVPGTPADVYSPVKPPSTPGRKPWYHGHIAEVGKSGDQYHAPGQWMGLRSNRDLRNHSEPSSGPEGVTAAPPAIRLLMGALVSLLAASQYTCVFL